MAVRCADSTMASFQVALNLQLVRSITNQRTMRQEGSCQHASRDARFTVRCRPSDSALSDTSDRRRTPHNECRKLDTEPLGSLGTLRVVGLVVVCVGVCM